VAFSCAKLSQFEPVARMRAAVAQQDGLQDDVRSDFHLAIDNIGRIYGSMSRAEDDPTLPSNVNR
jgi:hypothetical protein